jgi:hypothetical protein
MLGTSVLRLITIDLPHLPPITLESVPAPTTEGQTTASIDKGQWSILGVVCISTFMALLDAFIVNVALPAIQSTLNANAGELELVIATYSLTYAIFLIPGGYLWTEKAVRPRNGSFHDRFRYMRTRVLARNLDRLQGVARLRRCNNVSADPFNNPGYFQRSKARHRSGSVRRG